MASGSPQRRRSSVNVGFQENADNFVKQEINYEQWEHSIQNSDENTLRKFLQKQAEGEFDDLKLRLQTLRGEAEDIKEHMNSFKNAAEKLHDTTKEYMAKMHAEQEKRTDTANSKEYLSQQIDKQKAEIQAMQDKKRDLMNDKNKELNACTEKHLALLIKPGKKDKIQEFLLESFAQIISNDSSNTNWESMKGDHLKDINAFQLAMRQVDGSKLTKASLEKIRIEISGDPDAHVSQKKVEGEDSTVFSMITDEAQLNNNIMSFPFYRVLSKSYHYIVTVSKMKRHSEKLKQHEQELKQVDVKVKAHDEKISALGVFSILEEEAKNIEENEVAYFHSKLEAVNEQIDHITHLLSGTNFADEYFN